MQVRCDEGIATHMGVRHRTGRIARFAAQTRNGSARLPVPIDLGALGRTQAIDIAMGDFDPNRVNLNWDKPASPYSPSRAFTLRLGHECWVCPNYRS